MRPSSARAIFAIFIVVALYPAESRKDCNSYMYGVKNDINEKTAFDDGLGRVAGPVYKAGGSPLINCAPNYKTRGSPNQSNTKIALHCNKYEKWVQRRENSHESCQRQEWLQTGFTRKEYSSSNISVYMLKLDTPTDDVEISFAIRDYHPPYKFRILIGKEKRFMKVELTITKQPTNENCERNSPVQFAVEQTNHKCYELRINIDKDDGRVEFFYSSLSNIERFSMGLRLLPFDQGGHIFFNRIDDNGDQRLLYDTKVSKHKIPPTITTVGISARANLLNKMSIMKPRRIIENSDNPQKITSFDECVGAHVRLNIVNLIPLQCKTKTMVSVPPNDMWLEECCDDILRAQIFNYSAFYKAVSNKLLRTENPTDVVIGLYNRDLLSNNSVITLTNVTEMYPDFIKSETTYSMLETENSTSEFDNFTTTVDKIASLLNMTTDSNETSQERETANNRTLQTSTVKNKKLGDPHMTIYIIMGSVGGVLVILVIFVYSWLCCRRKKRKVEKKMLKTRTLESSKKTTQISSVTVPSPTSAKEAAGDEVVEDEEKNIEVPTKPRSMGANIKIRKEDEEESSEESTPSELDPHGLVPLPSSGSSDITGDGGHDIVSIPDEGDSVNQVNSKVNWKK